MSSKMIAVGDNVVDCYLDEGVYYPGGNAVNVAVNCRRDGIDDVAYIGMFGNDEKAEHLKWALAQEHVSFERSRTMYAPSGSPGVRLVDGDRQFVGGPEGHRPAYRAHLPDAGRPRLYRQLRPVPHELLLLHRV